MNAADLEGKASDEITEAVYTSDRLAASDLDHPAWQGARPVAIERYWSGEDAPAPRQAEARILWSETELCVRFDCRQTEPLVVSPQPQTERKEIGLWDRDVCELFIAPDRELPERYFEFEAAPNGEWLDLAVRHKPDTRDTDWNFSSGMTVASRLSPGRVMIALRVPWEALGRVPQFGEEWRANLFRCVGEGESRGYLAWRPTYTPEPDFHVPGAFGLIRFTGKNP